MGSNARVVEALQGVLFDLQVDGRTVRAVVLAQYLQRQFGALDDPDDWLRVYLLCQAQIDAEALRLDHDLGRPAVVIIEGSGDEDTMPAFLSRP